MSGGGVKLTRVEGEVEVAENDFSFLDSGQIDLLVGLYPKLGGGDSGLVCVAGTDDAGVANNFACGHCKKSGLEGVF
jgi:hypothetical protein